jgi:DNA-binding NtrC family response regulator
MRFCENREFLPLGASSPIRVDLRMIFATNQNLEQMVADGLFREDFYYRIFVYPIRMPALRERKRDILPIAYHFLEHFSQKLGKPISGFDEEVVDRLADYDWPGNVRQLRNTIERAVILSEQQKISLKDIPLLGDKGDIDRLIENIPSTNAELKRVKAEIRQKATRKIEKNFLLNALAKNDWNVTRAAKDTGLQRSNFHNLMKKYGISSKTRPGR